MITKYDLRKCKSIKLEMLELQERITEINSVMTAPRIPRLSAAPGGGGGNSDALCETIDKLDTLRGLYYKKLGVLAAMQLTIETAIEKLSADEQMLIRLYYFSNYNWTQVAARMGYEWAQIHRKHKAILEKLGKDDIE
jgi:hypothetical protein